ncbi:MAG: MauE/DoxX family redox-associated membrane protein [Mucilaginibacter sp.]|uniref:MauE/DoxX family redox-associated membrane protein n=1 Tax=Mucilaginibacter sp. TaxID=1882438 RepID=UPI00326367CA
MKAGLISFSSQRYQRVIAILLILLWAYSAVDKLTDFPKFRLELGKSPLISGFQNVVAVIVPLTELTVALLLRIKKTVIPGLYASFALLSLFTAYLVVILNYSYYIPCSCNGLMASMSWSAHIVFNIVCLLLTASAIVIPDYDQRKGGAISVA